MAEEVSVVIEVAVEALLHEVDLAAIEAAVVDSVIEADSVAEAPEVAASKTEAEAEEAAEAASE